MMQIHEIHLFELRIETNFQFMSAALVVERERPEKFIYAPMIGPLNDRLPVGLIAQLVKHCTGIPEVRVLVTFRPDFFRHLSGYYLSSAHNCENYTLKIRCVLYLK